MTKHIPRLDSVRAIAALMVAGFHAGVVQATGHTSETAQWLCGFFFDGRAGVSIFFVLSGLVLGMSLRRAGNVTPGNYFHFCGRRFFRIYPAYFVSTIFFLALYGVLWTRSARGETIGHGWFDHYATPPVLSGVAIAKNFCFASQFLNSVTWTLKVEMQTMFVLPLLHAVSLRLRGKVEAPLLLALVALTVFTGEGSTRINLPLFYIGYLIPDVIGFLKAKPPLKKFVKSGWLFPPAFVLLAASHLFGTKGMDMRLGTLVAGAGGFLLLLAVLETPFHPVFYVLDNRLVKYTGKVSYSFYLLGLLSVDLVYRAYTLATGGAVPAVWWIPMLFFVVICAFSLLLATACYYLVERSGIKMGGYVFPAAKAP